MGQKLCERDVKWHQLRLRLGFIIRAAVGELGWTPTSMGLGVPLVDIMTLLAHGGSAVHRKTYMSSRDNASQHDPWGAADWVFHS